MNWKLSYITSSQKGFAWSGFQLFLETFLTIPPPQKRKHAVRAQLQIFPADS